MSFFEHPQAICESDRVGEGTRIWAFAHVLEGARLGRDCNVCDHVFIENDVVVGDRVTIKSGVQLWDGLRIGDDVFIGPNATFTNDPFPRSRRYQESIPVTRVLDGASIGANATILPGVRIGRRAMVGAGSVVTSDVPPFAVVVGNPARITGYVESGPEADGPPRSVRPGESPRGEPSSLVGGAGLVDLRAVSDLRGDLAVAEFSELPFTPRRTFAVFSVPSERVRGEHAHRQCHQLLQCIRGSVSVVVDDGDSRAEVVLDRPDRGLHVPPMVWATQYRFSGDAVLLVLASHPYDPDDYIRDYEDFLRAVGEDGADG